MMDIDLYESFAATVPHAVFFAAFDGTIRNANGAASTLTGYTNRELLQMNLNVFMNCCARENAEGRFFNVFDSNCSGAELPYRTKDGTAKTGRIYSFQRGENLQVVILSDQSDPQDTGISGKDHPDEREWERMMKRTSEWMDKTEQTAHFGHWDYHIASDTMRWSDEIFRIFSLEPSSCQPSLSRLLSSIHPEHRAQITKRFLLENRETESQKKEVRILLPDQSIHWIMIEIHTEFGEDQTPRNLYGIIMDINDKKTAELELIKNLRRNESLVRIIQKKTASIPEMLDSALAESIALTESKAGYLSFCLGRDETYTATTWSKTGKQKNAAGEEQLVLSPEQMGILGEAIRQKKPILVNDTIFSGSAKETGKGRRVNLTKFLAVPVYDKDSGSMAAVIGVADKAGDYDQNDVCQLTILMSSLWEIVNRESANGALAEERERARITLLSIGDVVISTDENGKIMLLNPIAETLTGWTKQDALGQPVNCVFMVEDEISNKITESIVTKILHRGKSLKLSDRSILVSKTGKRIPISDSAAPILDDNGTLKGVVLIFRDVSTERRKNEEIEYLSFHDKLTGLLNRRYFERAVHKMGKAENLPVSIIMGDLNGLKMINDAFGHETGDHMLIKAASALRKLCRPEDVVARTGGDEFTLLLPNAGQDYAEKLCDRIKDTFSQTSAGAMKLSISLGYSTKRSAHDDIRNTMRDAEDMMYRNKLFESPNLRRKTIDTIMKALNERTPREKQHSVRVSEICARIGKALHFSETEVNRITVAGLLHDIGKIGISDSILEKTEALTKEDQAEIQRHPEIGYRILSLTDELAETALYVLSHHERWNGSGYPRAIAGEAIPFYSRILAVADVFDAMTSNRPYRDAHSMEAAADFLRRNAGVLFDEQIVNVFLEDQNQ